MEHLERLKQQLKEIFLGKVFPWVFLLFFGSIYLGLLLVRCDEGKLFLESLAAITGLMAGIAGLCASYVVIIGLNTWKKQIVAPFRYKSVTDARESILQLKGEIINMHNRIYAYGYDNEQTIGYKVDGDLLKKISLGQHQCLIFQGKLEVYFSEHHSKQIRVIENKLRQVNLQLNVYFYDVKNKEHKLVAYETLNPITEYAATSNTEIANSMEAHFQRKEKMTSLFSDALNNLQELEHGIYI